MATAILKLKATEKTAKSLPDLKDINFETKSVGPGCNKEFWIGRSLDASILLSDVRISRRHACFRYNNNAWAILDNKSSNGVMLNDKKINAGVFLDVHQGDRVAIVAGVDDFEWVINEVLSIVSNENDVSQQIFNEKESISEKEKVVFAKMKEDKLNLEIKVSEIEDEKRCLKEQREKMVKMLEDEKNELAEKHVEERKKFEIELKTAKLEAIEAQRNNFEERLKQEKQEAEEKLAAREKTLIQSIETRESRLKTLVEEKDDIIISLELEMQQSREKMKEMTENFEGRIAQLSNDCGTNEKILAQEHQTAIEDLKTKFNDMIQNNQKEMEATISVIKLEAEKDRMEKENIEQKLKVKDDENAKLKEELKMMKQKSGDKPTFWSKCNAELKCSICDEIFIEPMTLGCGHVYCKHCINEWENNCGNCFAKFNCPNCRQPITQFNKSLHLDNLITSLYEGESKEYQNERAELIEARRKEVLRSKEKQEEEKRLREQEKIEREQRRSSRNRSSNRSQTQDLRNAARVRLRQEQVDRRERLNQRQRNLQERVSGMRDRLASSEIQEPESSTSASTSNRRIQEPEASTSASTSNRRTRMQTSAVRIAEIRQRLLTEMLRSNSATRSVANDEVQVISPRTRQTRSTSAASVGRGSTSTPATSVNLTVDLTSPNRNNAGSSAPLSEETDDQVNREDHSDQESNISSQRSLSSSSSNSSDTSSGSSTNSDASVRSSASSVEGIPGVYYGGYGECYNCGRRGHWAPGCPY